MEMIIGGAYQGKTEYARKQYPQLRWSDGGSVTEEELMNAQGVTGFQQYIRSELENGKDVSDLAEKIICKNPDIVLVSQEVGYGVVPVDAFDRKYWDILFYGKTDGKYQLNLWEANRIVFLESGIQPEHISLSNLCTCCNPELLFSHRASHGKRGNLGAFLGLKK